MPCGCKGGRWTPPGATLTASGAVAGQAKGPHAPGYTAPSKNQPEQPKK